MGKKQYSWLDEDEVIDRTESVKKIWDSVMTTYPYVKTFNTKGVKEIMHVKRMGPYHMDEHKIKYSVSVHLDKTPLTNIGWNENDEITKEMVKKSYGEHYFDNMRERMFELLKYVGITGFTQFDFEGDISCSV